ncbi:MAG: ABC transporter ATP-binding protein [Candidatus Micrarchaeia archaeon]|jgi:putative ABC transport system ATP-binding protein
MNPHPIAHSTAKSASKCETDTLHLENVDKVYTVGGEKFYALDSLNLSVKKCDFSSLLGPSGSGKSTLLHIIGLLDRPSGGRVMIDGIDTSKMSPNERARIRGKKVGFVFQSFNLIPSLTSIENVKLPLVISGVGEPERTAKAKKILAQLGMADRLNHYPNQLSGGQKQRVAIARALVNDPEIILADEPTGNLDSKSGKEVLEILKKLHEEGRTIIIITHDESITKLTKKTLRIRDGKLIEGN